MGKVRPQSVALVATCPNCKESVEILVSKREIKAIAKGFKLGILKAQLQAEKEIGKGR